MKIDITKNIATLTTGDEVSLDLYREYLIERYPQLCSKLFIKLIISNGKMLSTYDWDTVFRISGEANIHIKFEQSCYTLVTSQN